MRIGALEAGGTKMVAAIGNENGEIFEKHSIPTASPAETLPELFDFFSKNNIASLGIASFGPVDLKRNSPTYGYITSSTKLLWQNCNIVGAFSKLNVPVGFDTDVNGSVLGEHFYGAAKEIDNIVYVTIGTGIGIGVISEGRVLHGMMHPEGGHVILSRHMGDNYKGKCPFHENCFEGLASGPAIEERFGMPADKLETDMYVWELEADYIAQALIDYTVILSPQRIILGGGVMHQTQLFKLIREKFCILMNGYVKTKELENLDDFIVPESLNGEQGIKGALWLGAAEAFNLKKD